MILLKVLPNLEVAIIFSIYWHLFIYLPCAVPLRSLVYRNLADEAFASSCQEKFVQSVAFRSVGIL